MENLQRKRLCDNPIIKIFSNCRCTNNRISFASKYICDQYTSLYQAGNLKTILSILLFGLLIFNTLGFSFYSILEMSSPSTEKIPVNDSELILKFPLHIPYVTDWQSTEPSDEEILKGNEYYKIVSKQIVNETLYVHCELSQTSRERFWSLVSTFDDEAKANSHNHKGESVNLLKNFLKEYMAIGRKHTFYFFEWTEPAKFQFLAVTPILPYTSIPSPPPDFV